MADATRCAVAGIDIGLLFPLPRDFKCRCTSVVERTCFTPSSHGCSSETSKNRSNNKN